MLWSLFFFRTTLTFPWHNCIVVLNGNIALFEMIYLCKQLKWFFSAICWFQFFLPKNFFILCILFGCSVSTAYIFLTVVMSLQTVDFKFTLSRSFWCKLCHRNKKKTLPHVYCVVVIFILGFHLVWSIFLNKTKRIQMNSCT